MVQRQEHGGQKEGRPLVWEDGRRIVFQTAVVMFEIDRALSSGVQQGDPPGRCDLAPWHVPGFPGPGHKSAAMTLDVYGHLWPDETERLAERMDEAHEAAVEALARSQGGLTSILGAGIELRYRSTGS